MPTRAQLALAHFLQYGPKRKVILAFRGIGKSWITSAYVCWRLLRNPQLNFLVVSASKSRSDDFSTFTLRLIREWEVLQHLRPKDGQRDSKIAFDVAQAEPDHAPSVKSVGITGQIAGARADEVIADDVEVPNNSNTQMGRDKLSEAVKEFEAVMKPGGGVTYLGTPQTEQSLYISLELRGYTLLIIPSRYPNEKRRQSYGQRLAPYLSKALDLKPALALACGGRGEPTDPLRFNDVDLMEREASYGRSGFALQFLLDTTLADADRYPLKLSDLIVMSLNSALAPSRVAWGSGPEQIINELPCIGLNGDRYHRPMWYDRETFLPYTGSVMTIDPSGRGKDETGFAVVKMLHGTLYCTAAGAIAGGYSDDTMRAIAIQAATQKVNEVVIEDNFGDGMFTQLLKPWLLKLWACTVTEKRSHGQKEARIIETLEPIMNQHRLVMDEAIIRSDFKDQKPGVSEEQALRYRLFYQMTRLTKEKGALAHDDRIEALAMAVQYWVEHMAQDMDTAAKISREEALDKELERFMEHALGAPKTHDGHATLAPWGRNGNSLRRPGSYD